ncbi:aspartyl-phosphate phosphatase Spo0E family protein [Rossellomorea aquimaris]|uniref:aspartyl-phosphate phosphatase Spo0E family protein n=1 Tax=Rossellomorea aquimaris TaxID=189382 RepID=UPI003CF3C6BD
MPQIVEIQPTLQVMEQKRIELQEYALLNGVSNPTTIQMSQELDKLINEFNQLKAT